MKPPQFYSAIALTAICLLLSVAVIVLGRGGQAAQMHLQQRQSEIQVELQQRQLEVNKGSMSNQVGTSILQDMAASSVTNPKMKEVLAKNGYNVTVNPESKSSPSPAAPFKP
jgi:hypothetical protein